MNNQLVVLNSPYGAINHTAYGRIKNGAIGEIEESNELLYKVRFHRNKLPRWVSKTWITIIQGLPPELSKFIIGKRVTVSFPGKDQVFYAKVMNINTEMIVVTSEHQDSWEVITIQDIERVKIVGGAS